MKIHCTLEFIKVETGSIISIKHYPLTCESDLKKKWTVLFEQSNSGPFLCWSWMSSWLASLPYAPLVIEATQGETCVGLGLFVSRQRKILPFLPLKQLWLHRFGSASWDQVWIEHNDFLLASQDEQNVRAAMLTYLLQEQHLWHELYLGLSNSTVIEKFSEKLASRRFMISSPDFEINLTGKANIDEYLAELSKNTRSQIQRSKKLLMNQGDISLTLAVTVEEKKRYLVDITSLHIEKWHTSEFGSGFTNPIFSQFHHRLILQDDDSNMSHLFCLRLDGQPLAYIYIIKDRYSWYFYLSAIKNSDDNRIKIGLLAHIFVIEQAIEKKVAKYSFLAGEARYKRSLCNTPQTTQQLICFYHPTKLIRFRERIRVLKRQLTVMIIKLQHKN
ncbi:MAG: CelD/BcsL family acetyltransferase involved in cellulose biosynthesis [Paraglaciecola sp.]|jgi:CelD/BcsL family acetyltransferase involved in cellulose biosynthesis